MVGVVLVFRDVTDRRRAEMERRDAAAERERLLEAERAARAEAERASRLKDEFVAMVSHELRTPLNAILGWTQLLMKPETSPDTLSRGLDIVSRNTRVQAQLISDLLDISRIASGKLALDMHEVDLAAVLQDAIDTVQGDADQKRITLHRELDAEVRPVAGDPARLQQVIWNLLSNAIKFTPQGGSVGVRFRQAGSGVEIVVTDTGVGIRSDVLPYIFDRFQQADRSITRRFGGLGIGLSIVKHIVELHGGTVRAESAGEGQGAVFTVMLPASTFARGHATVSSQSSSGEPLLPPETLHDIRVLLVEDDEDTCAYLEKFLRAYGADVTCATSVDEALAHLAERRPDVLVSDIGLPEVDGYELMQRIRRLPADAGGAIPAIALTAYARSEDRTRAFLAGYQAHLAKPIEPAELVATIGSFADLIASQRRAR